MDPKDALELKKLDLERSRLRFDVVKWLIVVVGAVVSFWVIDVGRLKLEEFKANSESEKALLDAYLLASETTQPEVWVRKLQVISTLSSDAELRRWAVSQASYVKKCSAKQAIYQETLRTAATLMHPSSQSDSAVMAARARFEELYWADLPYVGESDGVSRAMVSFRNDLIAIENGTGNTASAVTSLNQDMLELSAKLKLDNPQDDATCTTTDRD